MLDLFTSDVILRLMTGIITSGLATLGFSLLFKLRSNRLPWTSLGGIFTYLVYDLTILLSGNMLLSAFCSSLFMALYSEVCARLFRAPTFLFLLPCAVPIVPGSLLYYSFYYLFSGNQERAIYYIKGTAQIGLGIAVGLSFSSILVGVILQVLKAIRKQNKEHI